MSTDTLAHEYATTGQDTCNDRGPRIGEDGTRCRLVPNHTDLMCRTHPDDGFGQVFWLSFRRGPIHFRFTLDCGSYLYSDSEQGIYVLRVGDRKRCLDATHNDADNRSHGAVVVHVDRSETPFDQ